MDPNQNPQAGQQFTPNPDNQPPTPPQEPAPVEPVPQPPSDAPTETTEETPAYLKGADGPPAPGQATHPPGGYQAQTGEVVQAGVGGGAVIQKAQGDDNQVPAQVTPSQQIQPPPPDGGPPQAPLPQQTPVAPPSALPTTDPSRPISSGKIGQLLGGLNKRVVVIIVALILLPLLGSLAYLAFTGDGETPASRDKQLKSDVEIISTGLQNYFDDTGRYPTLEPANVAELSANYLPTEFPDPRTGQNYVLTTANPQDNDIQYVLGAVCSEQNTIIATSKSDEFALRVNLSDSIHCIDNQ